MATTIPSLVAGALAAVFLTAGLSKIFAAEGFTLPFKSFAKKSVAAGFVIGAVEAGLALGLIFHIQFVFWIVLALFGLFVTLALTQREPGCNCTARKSTNKRWQRVGLRLIGTGASAFLLLQPPSTSLPTVIGLLATAAVLVGRGHLLERGRVRDLGRRSTAHADESGTVGEGLSRRALLRQGATASVGVAALLTGSPLSALGQVLESPCGECPSGTECWCSSTGQCTCSPVDPPVNPGPPDCEPPDVAHCDPERCRQGCAAGIAECNYTCPLDCAEGDPNLYQACLTACENACVGQAFNCAIQCTTQFYACIDAEIAEYRECMTQRSA